jgi:hypothetical protein
MRTVRIVSTLPATTIFLINERIPTICLDHRVV